MEVRDILQKNIIDLAERVDAYNAYILRRTNRVEELQQEIEKIMQEIIAFEKAKNDKIKERETVESELSKEA